MRFKAAYCNRLIEFDKKVAKSKKELWLEGIFTVVFLCFMFCFVFFPPNINTYKCPFYFHRCSIGYPVVTLGFGFKSYVSYKMRLRKQKEVQKENEFYMQLLQQALPPEQQMLQRQEREAEEGTFQTSIHTHCTYTMHHLENLRLV